MISLLRKGRDIARRFYLFIQPKSAKRKYLDFKIFHYKNDSLINEINKANNGIYEEKETSIIVSHVISLPNPTILDVGANIGLMSLNICHYLPNVSVYAFEPGPRQFHYLSKNVVANKLQGKIHPFNLALSSKKGSIDFYIHGLSDSSGDGMIDTGRAGASKKIKVESLTLDEWWMLHNKPRINFIKIDTEGSELEVLSHGRALLRDCYPTILIEICYLNYEKYGLQFEDFIVALENLHYKLFTLNLDSEITKDNYASFKNDFYYLAQPQNS